MGGCSAEGSRYPPRRSRGPPDLVKNPDSGTPPGRGGYPPGRGGSSREGGVPPPILTPVPA